MAQIPASRFVELRIRLGVRNDLVLTQRQQQARVVLERLALTDEHVLNAGHREVLGEAVRAAAILPAQVLDARAGGDQASRDEMSASLRYASALLLRLVLSSRGLLVPSPEGLLELIEENPMGASGQWRSIDPLWGRIAEVTFLFGELSHVTNDAEADCLGALAALDACLEFLVALAADGATS